MFKKLFTDTLPVALIAVLSFIIIYKAVNIPVTFDEVVTWERYTSNASISDIVLNPDGSSNNHILNSLSVKVCLLVWSNQPWVLRLPNILSFFFFTACIYVISKKYFGQKPLLFAFPFFCLLFNPYLIDFFSLSRGYGMACAFMTGSIVCLLLFASHRQMRWYYFTFLLAMLSAYANFSFLIYWAAVQFLLIGILCQGNFDTRSIKQTRVISIFISLAFIGLCYAPLKNIQQCIQSTFGDRTGFFYDTILSETNRFNYGKPLMGFSDKVLSTTACLIGLLGGINFFFKIRRNKAFVISDPFNLVFLLLVLAWATNMAQVYCFSTSYLSGRTALLYYILFGFVLIFLLRDLSAQKLFIAQISAGLLSLFLIWHFIIAVNLNSVYEWSFDAFTYDVMKKVEDYHSKHPQTKTIELNITNFLHPSLSYYAKTLQLTWLTITNPQDTKIDTASQALFYYTTADHVNELKNYTLVKSYRPAGVLLPIKDASPVQVLLQHK